MNFRLNAGFLLILCLSLTQCTQDIPDVSTKIIGPYVQSMSEDEVTICWATLEGTTQILNSDSIIQSVDQYTNHKSIITRLLPGTTYSYDVLNDGTDRGRGTFTTFPVDSIPFHFTVLQFFL